MAQRAPTRHGAVFRSAQAAMWDLNFVYVERPAAPTSELVADAEQALSGLRHRMLVVDEPADATRLAGDLARAGWTVERHVAMVAGEVPPRRRRPAHAVREVPAPDLVVPRRRELRDEGFDEVTIAAVEASDLAVGRAMGERGFASLAADGSIAALSRLYAADGIGQIEDVATLREHRGAGHGQAVVLAALAASRHSGHELTFLWADEDDWPHELYARLGFTVAGRRWHMRRAV